MISMQFMGLVALISFVAFICIGFILHTFCWSRFLTIRNHFGRKWSWRGELYVRQTLHGITKDQVPASFRMCGYYFLFIPIDVEMHIKSLFYQGKTLRFNLKSHIKETSETLVKSDPNIKEWSRPIDDLVIVEGDRYVAYANGREFKDIYSSKHTGDKTLKSYTIYNVSCLICLETFTQNEEMFLLKCGHGFHRECIVSSFLQNSLKCPLCNAEVGAKLTGPRNEEISLLYGSSLPNDYQTTRRHSTLRIQH